MKPVFVSPEARDRLVGWFERFRARLPPTERRTVPTRFGDTHVLVGGPAAAPPLVLLHGALASSAHVLHELPALLERFRVHAVDIVGQSALSADARPSVKDNAYGEWLAEVMDGLALPRAHVVGVSWGGFVSIRLAAHAPRRIDRLVLLVPAGLVTGPIWAGFTKVAWPMLRYRRSPTPARLQAMVANLFTTTDDDWVPYLGDAVLAFNMDMRIPALAKPGELAGLEAPTYVLAADGDLSFPGAKILARAPALFPRFAGGELIPGCRHCPPTTPEFRAWLGEKIVGFLDAPLSSRPA